MESHDPLGLLLCNLTKENREWFGFKKSHNGVLVANILPGSIAANAGIMVEDLVTEWNGNKIETKNQLRQMIGANAGKEVKLSLLRAGEIKMVSLSVPAPERSRIASAIPKSYTKETKPSLGKKNLLRRNLVQILPVCTMKSATSTCERGCMKKQWKSIKKAIEADPDCAIAHFNLSIVYDKKA